MRPAAIDINFAPTRRSISPIGWALLVLGLIVTVYALQTRIGLGQASQALDAPRSSDVGRSRSEVEAGSSADRLAVPSAEPSNPSSANSQAQRRLNPVTVLNPAARALGQPEYRSPELNQALAIADALSRPWNQVFLALDGALSRELAKDVVLTAVDVPSGSWASDSRAPAVIRINGQARSMKSFIAFVTRLAAQAELSSIRIDRYEFEGLQVADVNSAAAPVTGQGGSLNVSRTSNASGSDGMISFYLLASPPADRAPAGSAAPVSKGDK